MSHGRVKPGSWVSGEQLTFPQINALDIGMSESLDKTVAGDTLSGMIAVAAAAGLDFAAGAVFQGTATSTGYTHDGPFALESGNKYGYNSRSIGRVAKAPLLNDTTQVSKNGILSVAAGDHVQQPLDLPHGSTLTDVSIGIDPSNPTPPGGGTVLPTLFVKEVNVVTGVSTTLGTVVDSTAGVGYGALHRFGVTGMAAIVNRVFCVYYIILNWETGAGALSGLVYPAAMQFTTTNVDEGAC